MASLITRLSITETSDGLLVQHCSSPSLPGIREKRSSSAPVSEYRPSRSSLHGTQVAVSPPSLRRLSSLVCSRYTKTVRTTTAMSNITLRAVMMPVQRTSRPSRPYPVLSSTEIPVSSSFLSDSDECLDLLILALKCVSISRYSTEEGNE